jgi:hypothetical protein
VGVNMFKFFKKESENTKFDRKILRRNDISLLILDERWNGLSVVLQYTCSLKPETVD